MLIRPSLGWEAGTAKLSPGEAEARDARLGRLTVTRHTRMANNKYNESIEDKAFKALDEALQIDFSKDNVPSRRGDAPQAGG